jgi:hypothetical protein
VAVGTVVLARVFVPGSLGRGHNGVAGPIVSVVGTILAVLLSFTVVTIWQEYDQAGESAFNEAAAIGDLYTLSRHFPQPTRSELQTLLRQYASVVVTEEWPLMREGKVSPGVQAASGALFNLVVRYGPNTPSESNVQVEAIRLIDTVQDARRDRLFDNQQGIPPILWTGILFISFTTIVLCALFSIRNIGTHTVLVAVVGVAVAIVLVLTAEFDYPFRGDTQMQPTAWHLLHLNTKVR